MTLDELRQAVASGEIDTVVLALTDMQGRLQGKRFSAQHFLDTVLDHGSEACNYLLAVDVEMNTVDGYTMASWDKGYGDFVMAADHSTLCRTPWLPGTALLLADLTWLDGTPVTASPRQILRRQIERLAERGWTALAATELEFLLFETSYRDAMKQGYRDMEHANLYNLDYSILATSHVEPLIRRIRNEMLGAGLVTENSKGECNLGQHEINFLYDEALATADKHVLYKNGAKEIADQEGMAITFMAKYDQREGSSCHVHLSLRDAKDNAVFADEPDVFESFLAGQLAAVRDLTLFLAPNVNSYKRFAAGSFAPTTVAWGTDNRTCAMRVLGHGAAKRIECRAPGADVNPYLAIAAMIAAGLHGVDKGLKLEPELPGNAYADDERPRLPTTLHAARDVFGASEIAREAFGQEVVDHYLNGARVELDAYDAFVTDWERVRGFERL
jgi:glutamine synthetase